MPPWVDAVRAGRGKAVSAGTIARALVIISPGLGGLSVPRVLSFLALSDRKLGPVNSRMTEAWLPQRPL